MAEVIGLISFTGLNGAGVITIAAPAGFLKAGDRVAGVADPLNGNSIANNNFGSFLPAENKIAQISPSDLTTNRFVAIIVRG